jgi:hypothetical protein
VSARIAADGVPINAPRPLPRPDRAMRLRLREQFHQRKQQSTLARCRSGDLGRRSSRCLAERLLSYAGNRSRRVRPWSSTSHGTAPLFKKKFKKNVLTPKTEIWYHAPLAPKQTKGFYPVGSLSVRIPINTKTNEITGRERTQQSNVSTQST